MPFWNIKSIFEIVFEIGTREYLPNLCEETFALSVFKLDNMHVKPITLYCSSQVGIISWCTCLISLWYFLKPFICHTWVYTYCCCHVCKAETSRHMGLLIFSCPMHVQVFKKDDIANKLFFFKSFVQTIRTHRVYIYYY